MAETADTRLTEEQALADAAKTPEPLPTDTVVPSATVPVSISGPVHQTALNVKLPDGSTLTVTKKAQHFAHEALDAIHEAARRCGVALKIGN